MITVIIAEDHQARLTRLETKPTLLVEGLPWAKLAGLCIIALLGLAGHISPETLRQIGMKLLGVG